MVVGHAHDAVHHDIEKRLDPLGLAPVEILPLNPHEGSSRPDGQQGNTVVGRRLLRGAVVLCLRQRRHAWVVGEHSAVNVAVHCREECRGGARVERDLVRQPVPVAIRAGEVVEELPPSLKLRRTRRRPTGFSPARRSLWRRRVVQVKGRDEYALAEVLQSGVAEDAPEFAGQGLVAVLRPGDIAQVPEVVEP